jgi:hypothetical protein
MTGARAAATPLYAWPAGLRRRLRVVLVAPPEIPAWLRAFLAMAGRADWIEVVALVFADAAIPRVEGVPADLRAFVALEHVLERGHRSLAAGPTPGDAVADGTALAARIDGLRPDLAILVGRDGWAGALAARLGCGAWRVDASLLDARHAGLSLLAPMVRREKATQTALMLEQAGGEAVELAASWGRTRATSFLLQREDCFRKLPGLLLRGLRRLAAGGVAAEPGVAALRLRSAAVGRAAGLRALATIARASPRWLTAWGRNGRVGWHVVLRLGGPALDPATPTVGSHVLLKAPKGWWGDPYAIVADGRRLVFVEEMAEPRRWKANIACIEVANGNSRRLGLALDEPGHLSFPQVFAWRGAWYMTVESKYDRRISLYRATDFPLGWTRACDLVTGWDCVDPTLHHHEGRWYLFANVAENGNNTCDELFLFVADRLEGPFAPHPASPIVCDVRRARMAGRLFEHEGRLIRPAQDCAPGYGNAVVFHEVLELGPGAYRERPLSRLAPALCSHPMEGLHTYNVNEGIEVLDVLGRPPKASMKFRVPDATDAGDGLLPAATACEAVATPPPERASGTARPGVPAG